MAIEIKINESTASNRCVPMWCVQSNGTSAATNESGNTFNFEIGGVYYGSGGSLSAVSAPMGLYTCIFSASKVSVAGVGQVMYSSGTALPMSTPFRVTNVDSYDSTRFGLVALPNAAAAAANGLLTFGNSTGQINPSNGSVAPSYADYSSLVTVGVGNIKAAIWSGVSVEILTGGIQTSSIGKGAYSGVSVEVTTGGIQVASIGKGSYSGVSAEVKSGGIQTGSIGLGNYSGVSVEILTGGIQTSSIGAGSYSGVSFEVKAGGIQHTSFGAGAIDSVAFATSAGQSVADRVLARNIATGSDTGTRTVQSAMRAIRNKVTAATSVMTVYQEDDATSAWTASVTTVATNIGVVSIVDPKAIA